MGKATPARRNNVNQRGGSRDRNEKECGTGQREECSGVGRSGTHNVNQEEKSSSIFFLSHALYFRIVKSKVNLLQDEYLY